MTKPKELKRLCCKAIDAIAKERLFNELSSIERKQANIERTNIERKQAKNVFFLNRSNDNCYLYSQPVTETKVVDGEIITKVFSNSDIYKKVKKDD